MNSSNVIPVHILEVEVFGHSYCILAMGEDAKKVTTNGLFVNYVARVHSFFFLFFTLVVASKKGVLGFRRNPSLFLFLHFKLASWAIKIHLFFWSQRKKTFFYFFIFPWTTPYHTLFFCSFADTFSNSNIFQNA